MKKNRKRNLMSGVALTCGAILLGSFNSPVANAASEAGSGEATAPAQTEVAKNESNEKESQTATEPATQNPATPKQDPAISLAREMPQADPVASAVTGVRQQTVAGEEPDLGSNVLSPDQWNNLHFNLQPEESLHDQGVELQWLKGKKPDVSKPGKSEGTAELKYTDPSTNEKKTVTVKVNVDVKAGKKKGTDEVRNRITYIDKDNNDIVASYSWVGKKNSNYNNGIDDGSLGNELDQAVEGLGYKLLAPQPTDGTELATFGDRDKTINQFVQRISNEPITWGQAEDDGFMAPNYVDSDGYNNLEIQDPTNLIANPYALPEGSTVEWGIKPKFADDGTLTSNPTIVIKKGGQVVKTLHLNPSGIDAGRLHQVYDYVPTWGNKKIVVGNNGKTLNPVDLLSNKDQWVRALLKNNGIDLDSKGEPSETDVTELKNYLFNPERWSWSVAPDLSQPGYTSGFAKFNPNPSATDHYHYPAWLLDIANGISSGTYSGMRLNVLPKPEEHHHTDPTPEPKPKPNPDPQPNENHDQQPTQDKPYKPQTDDNNDDVVVPTQDDEQTPTKTVVKVVKPVQKAQTKQMVNLTASPVKTAKQVRASLPQTGEVTSVLTAILAILTLGLSLVFFRKPKQQN